MTRTLLAGLALALAAVTGLAPAAAPQGDAARADAASTTAGAHRAASRTYELYRRSAPAKPYRWLACRAIDYRIDVRRAPAGVPATIRRTMTRIGAQLGIGFHDAGTDRRAFSSTAFSRTTPTIYFSFGGSDADGRSFASDGEVGVGGPSAAWEVAPGGGYEEAVLYGRVLLWSGFSAPRTGGGASWQSLITHEVGHALNLAHRSGEHAAMNPVLSSHALGRFTAAEVTALHGALQTSGCDYAAFRRLAHG